MVPSASSLSESLGISFHLGITCCVPLLFLNTARRRSHSPASLETYTSLMPFLLKLTKRIISATSSARENPTVFMMRLAFGRSSPLPGNIFSSSTSCSSDAMSTAMYCPMLSFHRYMTSLSARRACSQTLSAWS